MVRTISVIVLRYLKYLGCRNILSLKGGHLAESTWKDNGANGLAAGDRGQSLDVR